MDEITLEQDIEEALGMAETAEVEPLEDVEAPQAAAAEPEDEDDEESSEDDGHEDED